MSDFARDQDIRTILENSRKIAVVGLSPKPYRPSHGVAAFLQNMGYKIIPVNPNIDVVLDEQSYPDISTLPNDVDTVVVFRKPRYVEAIVDEVLRHATIKYLWLQEGVVDETAATKGRKSGLTVVMDRCMLKEYRKIKD